MVAPSLSMLSLHGGTVLFFAPAPCANRNEYRGWFLVGKSGPEDVFGEAFFKKLRENTAFLKTGGTPKLL
ncbi:hypothetical protein [Komagataeibacter xylinus]|uniref:hypothetical protein n=1 Tax=Komagataeibacter xylinus TaxID=28448 RepID=UPI00280C10C7|nr:hypothetical protein [Komagataeibacter xylinus]